MTVSWPGVKGLGAMSPGIAPGDHRSRSEGSFGLPIARHKRTTCNGQRQTIPSPRRGSAPEERKRVARGGSPGRDDLAPGWSSQEKPGLARSPPTGGRSLRVRAELARPEPKREERDSPARCVHTKTHGKHGEEGMKMKMKMKTKEKLVRLFRERAANSAQRATRSPIPPSTHPLRRGAPPSAARPPSCATEPRTPGSRGGSLRTQCAPCRDRRGWTRGREPRR